MEELEIKRQKTIQEEKENYIEVEKDIKNALNIYNTFKKSDFKGKKIYKKF